MSHCQRDKLKKTRDNSDLGHIWRGPTSRPNSSCVINLLGDILKRALRAYEFFRTGPFRPRYGVRTALKKSRPLSRVLSWAAIPLGCASPRSSSDLPGSPCGPHVAAKSTAGFPIWSCSRWGLPCRWRCRPRGALLPHHFTLTGTACAALRRYLSVALSVDSRPPGVTWHRALWSPDFPPSLPGKDSGCLADS